VISAVGLNLKQYVFVSAAHKHRKQSDRVNWEDTCTPTEFMLPRSESRLSFDADRTT